METRSEVIIRRTYARPLNDEETRFESWNDICLRVMLHQWWLWKRALGRELTHKEYSELFSFYCLMVDKKVSVSGRTLWLGGTEIAQTREASQFNCAGTIVETVYDVVDVLWLLMQGCGCGFKPKVGTLNGFFKPIKDIQVIPTQRTAKGGRETNLETWDKETKTWTISIGDSAEAWAKSIGKLLAGKYPADKLVFDFSEIRPAGCRLKGYGWISSGDAAISKAYVAIAKIMNRKAGELLSRIDILDIGNWLGTILSSRRSAEIALFEYGQPEWEEFALAKREYWNDNPQRSQSNNSLLFNTKPTKNELFDIFRIMEEGGGSEPGFINGEAALAKAPWFSIVNPCAEVLLPNKGFCVAGDTPLITRTGLYTIAELVGKEVEVWNGNNWSKVSPRITGTDEKMVRVSFGDGSYLDCTEYHRFSVKDRFGKKYEEVQAKDLMTFSKHTIHTEPFTIDYIDGIDEPLAYTMGFSYGDGSGTEIMLYGESKIALPLDGTRQNTKYRQNPLVPQQRVITTFNIDTFDFDKVFTWNKTSILKFIAGLADADGSNTSSGGIRIYQSDENFIRKLQLLLTKVGIKSSVNLMADINESSNFTRNKAAWYVQITECNGIPCVRLDTSSGHKLIKKGKNQTIKSVTQLDNLHTSYCFDEPERHMGVFNNTLTYQCNLVEVDVSKFIGDTSGLHEALRLSARANYRQTCVDLNDGILQESWHLNNIFLRLCGVGLTGIAQRPDLLAYDLSSMQRVTTFAAYSMADELGLQRPKNVCLGKPSGTLSKVFMCPEGIHIPLGKYIFNNVNFGKHDPLLPALIEANYRVWDNPADPEGVLVTFPICWEHVPFTKVKTDHGILEVNVESAIQQLNRYKKYQVNWSQQNMSNTISYSPDEVPAIVEWLLDNWDIYVGVSFLYRADPTKTAKDLGYLYLPQEVVSKEVYDNYVATLRPFNMPSVDSNDNEISSQEVCAGGVCPVK